MSWLPPDDEDDADDLWSEDDVRVRPNPKGNRPRTKTRPAHEDAVPGRVLGVDRGRYTVLVGDPGSDDAGSDDGGDAGAPGEHTLTATRARELRDQAIVTGDRVDLVGDTSGDDGTLARIVRVADRETLLRRSADRLESYAGSGDAATAAHGRWLGDRITRYRERQRVQF